MKENDTIVIAEDSVIQLERLENLLKRNNFNVLTAKNGRDAISIIRAKIPDLIISDIIMPEMDGYALCKEIKQDSFLSEIPVILLSSMNSPKDIILGIESGVDYYLTKPYDDDYLVNKVRTILSDKNFSYGGAAVRINESIIPLVKSDTEKKEYDPQKLINLLVCTYENALQINKNLMKSQSEVRKLNRSLEIKVKERTALLEQEISEREKNEQILKAVIEDAPAMICRFKPDGTITFVNHHFVTTFQKSGPRIIGENFFNLIENKEIGLRDITESLKEDSPVKSFGYTIESKKGITSYLECYIRALFDTRHRLTEFQAIAMDVTEQTKARAEKEGLEKQIAQLKTMETIGKLTSGIAHDFNNILSPLMVNAEMALSLSKEDTETHEHLEEIMKAAQRSKDMIRTILSFGQLKTHEQRAIKLQTLIMESISLLKSSIPANIKTRLNIATDCGPVFGNSTQIQRVIVNLCTNACHAMRQNGGILGIDLSEKELPADSDIKTGALKKGHYIHLKVSDTGCGIRPEILDHIFEPFFTTKEIGEGTGLGLSSVKGIIRSHKGDVFVESLDGKGSTFHVFIPMTEKMKTVLSPESDKNEELDQIKAHILLVDDDEAVLNSVSRILEVSGYTVTASPDSQKALKIFKNNKNNFNLLMTDLAMPILTGVELAREITADRPDMPVLIFTGNQDEISLFPDGTEYLIKPVTTQDMIKKIKALLSPRSRCSKIK